MRTWSKQCKCRFRGRSITQATGVERSRLVPSLNIKPPTPIIPWCPMVVYNIYFECFILGGAGGEGLNIRGWGLPHRRASPKRPLACFMFAKPSSRLRPELGSLNNLACFYTRTESLCSMARPGGKPLYNPSFHVLFHFILHYWGNIIHRRLLLVVL